MEDKSLNRMLVPPFLLLFACLYFPLLLGIAMAFQNYNMFNLTDVHFIGLDNFKAVITNPNVNFFQVVENTIVWVIGSLVLQFTLGFGLALLLRNPFRGRGVYSGFVFYGWALSGFAIGLLWSWLYNGQFGLLDDVLLKLHIIKTPIGFLSDTRFAMISVILTNVWYGVPFFGIMLLAALQSVPAELYEAARIDGASSLQQFVHVTVPYVRPTIYSTVLLRVMWISNFPDIIYGMTNGGPVNRTNILATQMINKVFKEYDYGQGSAIGFMIIVSLLLFAIIYLHFTSKKEN